MRLQARNAGVVALLALPVLVGCASGQNAVESNPTLDAESMLRDLSRLSHDSLEGRRTGSEGNAQSRQYIADQFAQAGLKTYKNSFEQSFDIVSNGDSTVGTNVVGYVPGTGDSEQVIVISAHYDHLGIRDGTIFNGADDNASGTAALIALARYISASPLEHTALFVAFDAEELGLQGARAFVADPPVPIDRVGVNVNMDMISHSDSVLYVAGTYHYPALLPHLQRIALHSPISLRFGHDMPYLPAGDDWTKSSDHGPFHADGIPFVYFGVEDHPDYHQPTDDFETINPDFYAQAVMTILDAIKELDRSLRHWAER